jgi:hypothetical protein
MLTVRASMFHLQSIILSETFCGKNADAAEHRHIFPFLSVFQRSVTHNRVQSRAHQAVAVKAGVLLCACVQFQHYSLHCFGVNVDLHKLVKIKDVP